MKAIPKKTFLLRQDELEGGKKKDVYAKKGVAIELTEKEVGKFYGLLELPEAEKKKFATALSRKNHGITRLV